MLKFLKLCPFILGVTVCQSHGFAQSGGELPTQPASTPNQQIPAAVLKELEAGQRRL